MSVKIGTICVEVITKKKIAAAFQLWMKKFTENPEEFEHEFQAVQDFLSDEAEYGEVMAEYFTKLLEEVCD